MINSSKASYGDRIKRSAKKNNSRIILALDMPVDQPHNPKVIIKIVDQFASYICAVKINFHLLLSYSPQEIRSFNDLVHSHDLQSIADIKLNDIPNTNSIAVKRLQSSGFDCLIANPIMGKNSLTSLVDFAHALNLGVLTVVYMSSPCSRQTYGLKVILNNHNVKAKISSLYDIFLKYSLDSNVDGIIVGANRIPIIKSISGRSFLPIYSPGVGFQGGVIEKAMENGSKYMFIGRSILNSSNARALLEILKETSNKYSL